MLGRSSRGDVSNKQKYVFKGTEQLKSASVYFNDRTFARLTSIIDASMQHSCPNGNSSAQARMIVAWSALQGSYDLIARRTCLHKELSLSAKAKGVSLLAYDALVLCTSCSVLVYTHPTIPQGNIYTSRLKDNRSSRVCREHARFP